MAEMHPFGHESPDVDAALVLKVVATLFGLLIVAVVALYFIVFHGVMSHHAEVVLRPEVTPPRPHLQPEPDADLARLRKQKRALLSGYAWVDPSHRFARIPIQRAMQLYVQEHRDDTPSATGSPDKRAVSKFHAPFMLRYLSTNGGKAEARTPHQNPFALRYRRAVREFPAPFLVRYLTTNGGGLRQDTSQHQNPFALRYRRAAREFSAPFLVRYLTTNGGKAEARTPHQHRLKWKDGHVRDDFPGFRTGGGRP